MASRPSQESAIRLSGKEVAGLAARVLMADFLPSGATGGASEAIEFLELTEGGALDRLDRQKEELLDAGWRAPVVMAEREDAALVDAQNVPAHFHGPVLADWLAAMVGQAGAGNIFVSNCGSVELLGASAHMLATREISSLVVVAHPQCGVCARLTLSGRQGWTMLRWTDGQVARVLAKPLADWGAEAGADGLERLRRLGETARALALMLAAGNFGAEAAASLCSPLKTGSALLAAFKIEFDAGSMPAVPADAQVSEVLFSADYAALKRRILAEGWPLDRPLWERLMAFADRSLIATSERSRQGAG